MFFRRGQIFFSRDKIKRASKPQEEEGKKRAKHIVRRRQTRGCIESYHSQWHHHRRERFSRGSGNAGCLRSAARRRRRRRRRRPRKRSDRSPPRLWGASRRT